MTLFRFPLARPLACLLWAVALTSSIHAADTPSEAAQLYEKAVRDYVDAAQKEVAGLRAQVKKLEDAGAKDGLDAARSGLSRAEELVEQLASAGPGTFDRIKGEYERSRQDVIAVVAGIRAPAAASPSTAGSAKNASKN